MLASLVRGFTASLTLIIYSSSAISQEPSNEIKAAEGSRRILPAGGVLVHSP